MIYYRQKIDSFTETFEKCSVIVLLGENYPLLQKDAKKISDALAGKIADEEMRVNKYFNHEINEKRNEIITSLKTKSFFPGRQIIMLNELNEKGYKIITEIDAEWQSDDAITIVTMNAFSKKSEVTKLIASSDRIAAVNYTNSKIDQLNYIAYLNGDHTFMFDEENIINILKMCDFNSVDFREFNPDIDQIERDFESMYVQAYK